MSEEELRERIRRRVPHGTAKANLCTFTVWIECACHRNTLAETQQDRYFQVTVDLVGFSYEHWIIGRHFFYGSAATRQECLSAEQFVSNTCWITAFLRR